MIIPVLCAAQPSTIRFHSISSGDGLSNENVITIVRDPIGYMWFGTTTGLNRYDGYTVRSYYHTKGDSTTIPNNYITKSLATKSGELWFGTIHGLCRYDFDRDQFVPCNTNPVEDCYVTSLDEDLAGNLWVGSQHGLFVRKHGEAGLERISALSPTLRDLDSSSVHDFCFTDSVIYVATASDGLYLVDAHTLRPTQMTTASEGWQKLYSNNVQEVLCDKRGRIWVGYYDGIIDCKVPTEQKSDRYTNLQSYTRGDMQNRLTEVIEDGSGKIWVSSSISSLAYFDERSRTFPVLRENPSINVFDNTRSAHCVYMDPFGTIWLGMHTSGVLYFNTTNQLFHNYNRPEGINNELDQHVLLSNWTRAFAEDPQHRLWIGTVDGVSILDREQDVFSAVANRSMEDHTIANNSIRSLLNVDDQYMLIGTAEGITRYDFATGATRSFTADNASVHGMRGLFTWCMTKTTDGVYVATSNGVSRFDDKNNVFYSWSDKPEIYKAFTCSARCIVQDDDGTIWIGTGTGKIIEFHPTTDQVLVHQMPEEDPQSGAVTDMMSAGKGCWVSTANGLMKMDPAVGEQKGVIWKEKDHPLNLACLAPAGKNQMWICSTSGLLLYDQGTGVYQKYTTRHGLPTNTLGTQQSFLTWDGNLCLASVNGFTVFDPDFVERQISFPNPQITGLRILNENVERSDLAGKEIQLAYDQNFFTLSLNTFDYLRQDNVNYAYMLDGLHHNWVYNGKNRELSFTNVPGGDYLLKFKATTSEGIWPDTYNEIRIHIDTVYFKTWWFRTAMVLLIVGLVLAIVSYRQAQKRKVELLRQKIASDLHDDIGATLSSIRMYSEIAISRQDNVVPLLHRISENAKEMVDSMGDMVWAIKPGNDRFEDLRMRMKNFALEMCGPAEIHLDFIYDEELSDVKLNMEQRRDLYLVFKEAVNNAVKYSQCQNLKFEMVRSSQGLRMVIADDGKGFDTSGGIAGNGLGNMKARMESMGGSLAIDSAHAKGTRITGLIPFTRIG